MVSHPSYQFSVMLYGELKNKKFFKFKLSIFSHVIWCELLDIPITCISDIEKHKIWLRLNIPVINFQSCHMGNQKT